MDDSGELGRPTGDPHPFPLDGDGEALVFAEVESPGLVAESFRLALAQERETVRKTYLEIAELRRRLEEAEARAARVKASLSLTMGTALVRTRGPWDFMTLGVRLLGAYRAHRRLRPQPRQTASTSPVAIARRAAALQQALALTRSRGGVHARQWTRSNVRNTQDRARILVEIGLAVLPADPAFAREVAAEVARLVPDSVRAKALLLSIQAVETVRETVGTSDVCPRRIAGMSESGRA